RFWEERLARYFLTRLCEHNDSDESQSQRQKGKTSKGSRKKYPQERISVQKLGHATGMLTEDVITTLKSMGAAEPDTKPPQSKQTQSSTEAEEDSGQTVILRKSKVLDWAKTHKLTLGDP